MKLTWDALKTTCAVCHYKDSDPSLCNAVKPPREKEDVPDVDFCGFLPESYWTRLPDERKQYFDELRRVRSGGDRL